VAQSIPTQLAALHRLPVCRVTCSPLLDSDKTLRGVIMVVVDEPGQQPPTG
jgi:hypothetical protein